MPRPVRSRIVSVLAVCKGLTQKQIGVGAGLPQKKVSYHLREGNLEEDALYGRLLQGVRARPAEVELATSFLEALDALDAPGLTPEERDEVEAGILEISRLLREFFAQVVQRSRSVPPRNVYPGSADLEASRWMAGEQWKALEPLSEDRLLAIVQESPDFWSWALVERVCEESVVQASRKVERSAALARLAQEIADRIEGPDFWRSRVQGFATAHAANALRVAGELRQAEALLERAKQLWEAGADPEGVLDPGRIFNLEGALRRDQRRFAEALTLLDQAAAVGRSPELALIQKGFTLEVMGEYERAVEVLLEAEPLVEHRGDMRLMNILCLNLAWDLCHLSRFSEAKEMAQQVRTLAADMGDEIGVLRVLWLEGRIIAGLGRTEEARRLLEQARREFVARRMDYDAALALLEEAALLLEEGRAAEVKTMARGLAEVFDSKGVHREALAALRLFQEAAEREEATAELARRILGYLFRARYDQGLRFTPT